MIELLHEYFADVTPYGYNLVRKNGRKVKSKKKDGTEEERDGYDVISYHGDLASCIKAALRESEIRKLMSYQQDISLDVALREIKILHTEFADLLQTAMGGAK